MTLRTSLTSRRSLTMSTLADVDHPVIRFWSLTTRLSAPSMWSLKHTTISSILSDLVKKLSRLRAERAPRDCCRLGAERAACPPRADQQNVGRIFQVTAGAQFVDQCAVDPGGGIDVKVSQGGRGGQAREPQAAGQP